MIMEKALSAVAFEKGEARFGTRIRHPEPQPVAPEPKARGEVGHVEFRDEGCEPFLRRPIGPGGRLAHYRSNARIAPSRPSSVSGNIRSENSCRIIPIDWV